MKQRKHLHKGIIYLFIGLMLIPAFATIDCHYGGAGETTTQPASLLEKTMGWGFCIPCSTIPALGIYSMFPALWIFGLIFLLFSVIEFNKYRRGEK